MVENFHIFQKNHIANKKGKLWKKGTDPASQSLCVYLASAGFPGRLRPSFGQYFIAILSGHILSITICIIVFVYQHVSRFDMIIFHFGHLMNFVLLFYPQYSAQVLTLCRSML